MTAPLLSVTHLSAAATGQPTQKLLRDVSLDVAAGEVHGLLGESGAGKSTIARAVLGMLPRGVHLTAGAITLAGTNLLTLDGAARRRLGAEVALIPQDPLTALNPSRRIEAQITDGLRLWKGLSAKAARAKAGALLEEVQMRDPERVLRAYPHQLSGGMRQRVLIAAAFALEPRLIVADEPTTALDVTVQKQILRLIRALQERHRTSVVFITHDLGVVAQICDRVTLLYRGRVMEQGSCAEFFAAPRHAYTQALIAASPRHDRPEAGLSPVPEAVIDQCRREVADFDAARAHG